MSEKQSGRKMTEQAEKLKSELAALSVPERAELARYLILSLDTTVEPEAEAAWDDELARRGKDISDGTADGSPAAEVFSDLRKKYS